MKSVIFHRLARDHYTADACALWCFDSRFSSLLTKLAKKKGWKHIDLIKVAGGAKGVASPALHFEREYLIDQIAKSIRLHHPRHIALMVHADCGAYGNPKFSSHMKERTFFSRELKKARAAVRRSFRKNGGHPITITQYFADFNGLHELHQR